MNTPMNQFPKGMSRRNKRQCQEGYQHEMQGTGFNLVDCGSCGSAFLHRTSHEEVECPFCDYRSEQCDFPDHFHYGFADSAEFLGEEERAVDKDKRPLTRHFDLPDGTTFQIVFGEEGAVYDLIGKDGEVDLEYGYDFYEDLLPKEYKHESNLNNNE